MKIVENAIDEQPNSADDLEIENIAYSNSVLKINSKKSIVGIFDEVWNYEIGGYKVIDKWFKEHKCEKITLQHFTHIEIWLDHYRKQLDYRQSLVKFITKHNSLLVLKFEKDRY